MKLIIYYVALALAGDLVAVMLCLGIEKIWPAASVGIFIFLYFSVLWGAWVVAVRLTEPKEGVLKASAARPMRPAA